MAYTQPYFNQPYPNAYGYGQGAYQPMPQPMQAPIAQQVNQQMGQQPSFIANELKYMTEDEIKAFPVAPNYKIHGLDKTKGMLFIKSADGAGNSALERYKLLKVDDNSKKEETPSFDLKEYAKTKDLEGFVTSSALTEQLTALRNDINKKLTEINKSINIKKILEDGGAKYEQQSIQ